LLIGLRRFWLRRISSDPQQYLPILNGMGELRSSSVVVLLGYLTT
jgi:hypothetical protein